MLAEIERTCNSVQQLRALVSDLLDVARLDHGLFRIEPALLDVVSLVEDSARALETPRVIIQVHVQSTGRMLILADAARLRQCVDNLIANAIELAKRIAELHGGELSVESKAGRGARFMLSLPCRLEVGETAISHHGQSR